MENVEKLVKETYADFNRANGKETRMAFDVVSAVLELGMRFSGKKVIDIGSGLGHKAYEMKSLGATVWTVEPSTLRYAWALERGFIKKGQAFNCLAQDLPEELYGTFDLVTIYKYRIIPEFLEGYKCNSNIDYGLNINAAQLQVSRILAKLIKPSGEVIIELYNTSVDHYLYYPDSYCTPLIYQLKKLFQEVEYADTPCSRSIFIRARKPFNIRIIDRVSCFDICMGGESVVHKWHELLKQGCYYLGVNNPDIFKISADRRSLIYIPKKNNAPRS